MRQVSNQEISEILREIGIYLDMQSVAFKPRAFEKAAEIIGVMEDPLSEMYAKGGIKALLEIEGVGKSIAQNIEELLLTGRSRDHQDLKKKVPVDLSQLRLIGGLGPKSIKKLYETLKIKNREDLEKAARAGKIAKLAGFGPKSEENILKSLEFVKHASLRFLLGSAMPEIRAIEAHLASVSGASQVTIAGSARRKRETVGDADILVVSSHAESVMQAFVSHPSVVRVLAQGETRSSVQMRSGLQVDLRVVPKESYGAALNYFTGSKAHNVALRSMAIKKGLKLNEYGLFRGKKEVAGETEENLYRALGMDYIEPELRENTGEIEAAKVGKLPRLLGYKALKGDLQVQTDWTDGSASIEVMAKAAHERGLEYIAITDHTKRLAMTHGLDEKRIIKQWAEIDRVNKKLKSAGIKIRVLKGTECDILKDGSLDLRDDILSKLEVVGVSVHSYFDLPEKVQTERILKAISNPNVDILFHPTGRLIEKRKPYEVDMDAVIARAKKTKTVMEVDAFPDRLDLKDEYIRKCVNAGVRMSIDSDAHAPIHFNYLEYGIAQARRGWAEPKHIVNAQDMEKMIQSLKS